MPQAWAKAMGGAARPAGQRAWRPSALNIPKRRMGLIWNTRTEIWPIVIANEGISTIPLANIAIFSTTFFMQSSGNCVR